MSVLILLPFNAAFGSYIYEGGDYDGDSIVDDWAAYFENLSVPLATPLSDNKCQKNTSMDEIICTSCGG